MDQKYMTEVYDNIDLINSKQLLSFYSLSISYKQQNFKYNDYEDAV